PGGPPLAPGAGRAGFGDQRHAGADRGAERADADDRPDRVAPPDLDRLHRRPLIGVVGGAQHPRLLRFELLFAEHALLLQVAEALEALEAGVMVALPMTTAVWPAHLGQAQFRGTLAEVGVFHGADHAVPGL